MDFNKAARINELYGLAEGLRDIAKMVDEDEDKDIILSQMRSAVALLIDTSNAMHDEMMP